MINLLFASLSLVTPATRPAIATSLHRPVVQRPLVAQRPLVSQQPHARSHIVMEEPNLDEQRLEAVSRSGDPFRAIRYVLYGIFGLVGVAGVGVGLMQGDVQNAGINAGVAVGAGALYFVDQQATGALKEKTREEIENPMLGGGIKSYLDTDGDEEDDVPEAAPAPPAEAAAAAPPSEQ